MAAMAELPFMGVPVSVGTQKRRQERSVSVETQTTFCGRERSVSVGTQTICEQECSVLSEVFEDTENPEQETASAGGDLGRGEPRASDAHFGAGSSAVQRASAQGSAPGSASSSAQSSAHCSSSSTRDSGSGTRKATGEATVAAPASGWETGQELPRAQYDLRPKTAAHLNILPPSYTDFGAGVVERASAPMNVGRVLDGLTVPSYTDFGAGVVERASALNVGQVLDGLLAPSYKDFGAGVVERASALMNVGQVLDGLLAPSGASCQASRPGCAPQAPPHAREGTPSLFPSNFESRQQSTAGTGGPKTRTYSRLHSRNVRRIETIQDAPQGQITKTSRPRRGSLDRRARTRETHGMKMLIRCSSRGASSLSRGRASVPVGVLWLLSNRRCEAAWAVTDAVLGQFWAL